MASVAFHLVWRWSHWRRRRFAARMRRGTLSPVPVAGEFPATLTGFCGQADLPEQVASWRSFQRWVGRPRRVILVSDGTLGAGDVAILRAAEPAVEIRTLEEFGGAWATPAMRAYAAAVPMGRKLFVMRALGEVAPCLYADSDILFFRGAAGLRDPALWGEGVPRYLFDPYTSLDRRLIRGPDEGEEAVNGGLVVVPGPLDWSEALHRLDRLEDPAFFTEQTLAHLVIRRAGGRPLDRHRYVLRNEDQWAARDWFVGPDTALRHYISSIRYKFWAQAG